MTKCKVLTTMVQKGGTGKTTTTGILAYLLAQEGNKVLCIDLDSQGNLSELLTDTPTNEYIDRSVLEALQYEDADSFIVETRTENVDILPAHNLLSTIYRWIYTGKNHFGENIGKPTKWNERLNDILQPIKERYDYILIDTAPSLSEVLTMALFASDYALVMFECNKFCYSALPNLFESLNEAKEHGAPAEVIGILRTMSSRQETHPKKYARLVAADYPEMIFKTTIYRAAAISRIPTNGLNAENKELEAALDPHKAFYKELLQRVTDKELQYQ